MSSSLFNSPVRKQPDNQKAEDTKLQKNDSINMPEAIRPKEAPADENTNQIKNPLQHIWQETKNFLWHAPKAVEGAVCLVVTAAISLVSVAVYFKEGSAAACKFKNDCLEVVVENVRSFCNKNIYCGSLFDHQKSFLKQSDGELKDNLNPFKWLGESLMSACMYGIDWSRSTLTRFASNLVRGKDLSAEDFREYEYQNTGLRLIKNSFDLAKGFISLFVIRKINSGKSFKDLIRPLTVATGMSAASAVGEKWQEGKSALNIDTAEQILAGSSNSLAFMGLIQSLSLGYVSRASNFQEKISRSLRAQSFTEFYDLRDSILDLVNALHKGRHDLWDKDTGKPRDKWAILGHLLSTGAAASDAAELKASGLSKVPVSDKIKLPRLPLNVVLPEVMQDQSVLALPTQDNPSENKNKTKVKQYNISDLKGHYIACRKRFLIDKYQDQVTERAAEEFATKDSENVLAYFDPYQKCIVVANATDLQGRGINPEILRAILVVHETIHLSSNDQELKTEEEFQAWQKCLQYARSHEIDILFNEGFVSFGNIEKRKEKDRQEVVIKNIRGNQPIEVVIPLRKQEDIRTYIAANYDPRYSSIAIKEERDFSLLNSARVGVNRCKEVLEILKSSDGDPNSDQKLKKLLLTIANTDNFIAEEDIDNGLFSKDKEEFGNLVAEIFAQRDRNFWDEVYQAFTELEQLKINSLVKLGLNNNIKKLFSLGARESNLELLLSNISFFSEELIFYLQDLITKLIPKEFNAGCSSKDFKLFEELLLLMGSFLKNQPVAFSIIVRTKISQEILELLASFEEDTVVSLEAQLQFNMLIKTIPYTQYEKDIIRTKQILKQIAAGNIGLAKMLAQQYQVPREIIFECFAIQMSTDYDEQLVKQWAEVESVFEITDDDLELIVDVTIKQVAISYNPLEMAEVRLLKILRAINVEEEDAIDELHQIYADAYRRSVERIWSNLKEAKRLNNENKVIEAKLKLIDLFNLAIEDLISTQEIIYYQEFKKATGDYFFGVDAYRTLSEDEKIVLAEIINAELDGRLGKLFNQFLLINYNGDDDVIILQWNEGLEILDDLIRLGTGQEIIKQQIADYLSITCDIYLHAATVKNEDEFKGLATSIQYELARILRKSPQLIDQVLQESDEAVDKIAYTLSQMILSENANQDRIETFLRAVFIFPTEGDVLSAVVSVLFDKETLIAGASFGALKTIISAAEAEMDFETRALKFNLLLKLLNTEQLFLLTEAYWDTYNDDNSIKFDPAYFMELSNYLSEHQLELSPENLMVLLKIYAQFAIYEPLLFEYFEKEINRLWEQLSIDQIITVIYCFQIFAVVSEDNSTLLRVLNQCEADNKKQIEKAILNDHIERIKLIYSAYRIAGRNLPEEFSKLEDRLKKEVPLSMSPLEFAIHKEFLSCGINIVSTKYVEGLQPDFILQIAGRKIIIKADGLQFHYINSNPKEGMFGFDRVRDKIYADAGYEVIRITNEEYNANSENFLQYFAGRLGYSKLEDFIADYQRSNESTPQNLEPDILFSEEQRRLESEVEKHPFIRKFDDYLSGSTRLNNISSIYEQGSNSDIQQVVSDISVVYTEEADQLNNVIAELQDQYLCIVRSRHKKSQLINAAFVLVKDEKQGYARSYVPILLVPEVSSRDYWKDLAFQLVLLHCRNYLESDIPCPLAIKHQQENTPEIVHFVLTALRLAYPEVNFELREIEETNSANQTIKVSEIVPKITDRDGIVSRETKKNMVSYHRENLARLTFFAVAKRYEITRREQRNINARILFCSKMAMSYGPDGSVKAYEYAIQVLEDLPNVAEPLKEAVLSHLISYISSQKYLDKGKALEILERIINEIAAINNEDLKCKILITYIEALTRLEVYNLDLNSIYENTLAEARALKSTYSKLRVLLKCLEMFVTLKIRIEGNELFNLLKECYQEAKKVETPYLRVQLLENCFTLMPKIQEVSASQELIDFCRKEIIKDIRRIRKENKVEASRLFIAYIEHASQMNLSDIPWVKLIERGISLFDFKSKAISQDEAKTIQLYFELISKLGEVKLGKDINLLYEKLLNNDLYYRYPELFGSLINLANEAGGPLLEQFMLKLFTRFDRVRYPKIEFTYLIKYFTLLLNKSISEEKLFGLYKKVLAEIGKHSLVDRETHLCINNFLVSIKLRREDLSKADLQILCRMMLVILGQLYESSPSASEDVILQFMETVQFLAGNGFKEEVLPVFPEILDTIRSLKEVTHRSYLINKYIKITCTLKIEETSWVLAGLFAEGLKAAESNLSDESVYIVVINKYIDLIPDNSFKKIAGLQYAFCQEVLNAIEKAPLHLRMLILTHFADLIKIHGKDLVEIKDQVEKIAKNICVLLPEDIYTLISYINILQKLAFFTTENKAVSLCDQVLNKIRVLKDGEQVKKLLKEYFFAIQFLGAEVLGEDLLVVCRNVKEFILAMADGKEKAELLINYIDFANDLQIVYPRAEFEDLCRSTLELIIKTSFKEEGEVFILGPDNQDKITLLSKYIEKLSQDKTNHKLLLEAVNVLFSEILKYEGSERVVELYPEVLIEYFGVLDHLEDDTFEKVLKQQSSRLIALLKIKQQQNDSSLKCYLDLILKLPPNLLSSLLNRHYNRILSVIRNVDDDEKSATISEFLGFVKEFNSMKAEVYGFEPPLNYLKNALELIDTLNEDEKVRQLVEFLNVITEIKDRRSSSLELVELYNKGLKKLLLIDHLSDYSDNNIRGQLLTGAKFQFNNNMLSELIQLRNPKILKEVGLVCPHFADSYISRIKALRVTINQGIKTEIANVKEHQEIKAIKLRVILEETAKFLDLSIEQVKENDLDQIEQMLTFGILESREAVPAERSRFLSQARATHKQKGKVTVDSDYNAASYRDALGMKGQTYEEVAQLCDAVGISEQEAINTLATQIATERDNDNLAKLKFEKNYREKTVIRYLEVLIDSNNQKGISYVLQWVFNKNISAKRREYLIRKLFDIGYWDQKLGQYLSDNYRTKNYTYQQYQMEYHYLIIKVLCAIGISPELSVFKLLESSNPSLQAASLEERVEELAKKKKKYEGGTKDELIELLKTPEEAVIYYGCFGGQYSYALVKNFDWTKLNEVMSKAAEIEQISANAEIFEDSLKVNLGEEKSKELIKTAVSGRVPLLNSEINEFDIKITEDKIGFTKEDLDQQCEDIWTRQLVQIISSLVTGRRPKSIAELRNVQREEFKSHSMPDDFRTKVEKLLDELSEITTIEKLESYLEAFRKSNPALASVPKQDLIASYIKERIVGIGFVAHPLFFEWHDHVNTLIEQNNQLKNEICHIKKNQTFRVRFIDKVKDLIAAIRFKDGMYSCINSSKDMEEGNELGNEYYTVMSQMYADAFSFMIDIRTSDSPDVIGSVGIRMGLAPINNRPVVMLQGIYCENKGPAFVNSLLELIEIQLARTFKAGKIILANQYGGSLFYIPLGYRKLQEKEFVEINAISSIADTSCYDDIGTVRNGLFRFSDGFVKELEYSGDDTDSIGPEPKE